ncbi:MAG: DUF4321 domain-containing protein [Clostridiales bacterium]|nr:DUF4321 domain-containing protein [Clostridiales bacterium]
MKDRKNALNLFLLFMAGMVVGGFIGYYLGQYPLFTWLNYGKVFGMDQPVSLEFGIIHLVLGIKINIDIASIFGMVLGGLVYRQM